MTEDELAAVIAAATAVLRTTAPVTAAQPAAWKVAARLGALDAPLARIAARANSPWNASGRIRG